MWPLHAGAQVEGVETLLSRDESVALAWLPFRLVSQRRMCCYETEKRCLSPRVERDFRSEFFHEIQTGVRAELAQEYASFDCCGLTPCRCAGARTSRNNGSP